MTTPRLQAAAPVASSTSRTHWRDYAPAVIATAFASLPLFNRVGVLEISACVGVALCAAWSRWQLARSAAAIAETPPLLTREASELNALLRGVLPVWLRHIGSVKHQTEEAVTELATGFSSIVKQFDSAGLGGVSAASAASHENGTLSLLALSERQLTPVVSTMEKIIDSKVGLLESVRNLQLATHELKDMASDVSLIAAHTNILAINAAIEAARTGEAGRGFAVIAAEIRKLSQLSAETGKKITARMAQITQIMQQTLEVASVASARDQQVVSTTSQVIVDVLLNIRTLGAEAEEMRAQRHIVRAEVERLLVNLQFQDRVSQVLAVVDDDIGRLHHTVEIDGGHVPTAIQWLRDLDTHYTMEDERATRQLGATRQGTASPVQPAEDVTFF